MRIYNAVGWGLLIIYSLVCMYFAPSEIGPWAGLAIGSVYLVVSWLITGVFLSCVVHMGIAHRALEFKEWFVKTIAVMNSLVGVYVNPVAWVNRHRLHHKFSDHPGDPSKLSSDGFWRTLYLCLSPYKTEINMADDAILKSRTFRVVAHPLFGGLSQVFNFSLLWWLVGDLAFAAAMWIVFRLFALWVNMIQNFWAHDRRFGYRRYHDEHDNAMNIGEWLPVTATFSACLQNNHHHSPGFLRLSHDESEYDLGFTAVKIMKSLGLVRATSKGATLPKEASLTALNF